ncbi:MAG: sortase [bacterium]
MIEKWLRHNHHTLIACAILVIIFLAIFYLQNEVTTVVTPPPPLSALALSNHPAVSPRPPHIIIPGLTEPLPLIHSDTLAETQIQQYLKEGAVILPLGTTLGEPGNVVITAHSSGFESFGPYRFAFAKLGELEVGEEFQITAGPATYTYRIYKTEVVWPSQVDKLPQDDRSTVTLVTCWPIWTNFKRLLVHSELINVDK